MNNIQSITYTNAENTSIKVVADDGEFHCSWPCNTWHNAVIQEWLAVPNTINPYPNALADAKAFKQNEIKQEFYNRSSADGIPMTLDDAIAGQAVFAPVSPATPESTRFYANIGAASAAIVFVDALIDAPTVNAYDPVNDPSWSA